MKKRQVIILSAVIFVFLLIVCCVASIALRPNPTSTIAAPILKTTTQGSKTIAGKGNAVVQLNATLTGPYQVNYKGSSTCIIVHFLQKDSSDGAAFMDTINDCVAGLTGKISGSTVVELSSVTMVEVENTSGNWTLQFTPIG